MKDFWPHVILYDPVLTSEEEVWRMIRADQKRHGHEGPVVMIIDPPFSRDDPS